MVTDRASPFLAEAIAWRRVADRLRAAGVAGDAALGVYREAAFCHLLAAAGKTGAAVARLRAVVAEVTGRPPSPRRRPPGHHGETAIAEALFARLRAYVKARHPGTFGPEAV